MPISISSSARVKLGSPACGTMHGVSARPIDRAFAFTRSAIVRDLVERVAALGGRTGDLLDEHRAGDAASACGVERVLHGDVVVRHDRAHLDAVGRGEVGRRLEVQHVARVVLDDVEHARAAVDGLRRGEDRVGRRRGEHGTGHGGVEHAEADEARRAAARARCRRRSRCRPCRRSARRRARRGSGRSRRARGRRAPGRIRRPTRRRRASDR